MSNKARNASARIEEKLNGVHRDLVHLAGVVRAGGGERMAVARELDRLRVVVATARRYAVEALEPYARLLDQRAGYARRWRESGPTGRPAGRPRKGEFRLE